MAKNDVGHIGYGISHSLAETAQMMGITREGVRQIEKRALEKLRLQLLRRFGVTNLSDIMTDC
jgi:DNA-directed RNA polymerase, sigma subunit (sigma70/sigma32)